MKGLGKRANWLYQKNVIGSYFKEPIAAHWLASFFFNLGYTSFSF
jgi:hypothetical protein